MSHRVFGDSGYFGGLYPSLRHRRTRRYDWSRRLVREVSLSVSDLIWPIFVCEGSGGLISSMPGISRLSVEDSVLAAREAYDLGIPVICIFPYISSDKKDSEGSEALNPDNLVCRSVRAIKSSVPDLGIMCDVALDPYTSHGHDGLLSSDGMDILNDATIEVLVRQSLLQADAGCDILSPSDMMDGRVGKIREALESGGYDGTQIMSYSAKYASCFYGPFRDAVGSGGVLTGDKKGYQMDFSNSDESLREAYQDICEGSDMLLVKPGIFYLDILYRLKTTFGLPVFSYQVSGEYSMLCRGAELGCFDLDSAMIESLYCFRRAGADGIVTYFAPRAARLLRDI